MGRVPHDFDLREAFDIERSRQQLEIGRLNGFWLDSNLFGLRLEKWKSLLETCGLSAICRQRKLTATDGKRYSSDCLTQKGVDTVLLVLPGKYRAEFSDWIAGMALPLDERSKQRSYELWDSPTLDQDWWELSRGSSRWGCTKNAFDTAPLQGV